MYAKSIQKQFAVDQEVKELPKETMQKEEEGAWAIVFVRFGPSFLDFRTWSFEIFQDLSSFQPSPIQRICYSWEILETCEAWI